MKDDMGDTVIGMQFQMCITKPLMIKRQNEKFVRWMLEHRNLWTAYLFS